MSGSNVAGMSGSNVAGMSGSNVAGMSGSNVAGMSGSNVAGMSGSNLAGMSGSNLAGMSGSNERSLSRSNGPAYRVVGFGAGLDLAAMGSLDGIAYDGAGATFTVVGQTFNVAAEQAADFAVGDYVVAGTAPSGAPAIVYHVGAPYVPGVSTVRVKGAVQVVDSSTARLTVGALTIDYAQQLSAEPSFSPVIGDVVNVAGVQPAPRSVLLVDASGSGISVVAAAP